MVRRSFARAFLALFSMVLLTRLGAADPVVVVPTVEITSLGHFNEPWVADDVQMGDGVAFPCGGGFGTCSGPGFTASIETGTTIHIRFAAPPGMRFRVIHDAAFYGQLLEIDADWHTGAPDGSFVTYPAPVAFENLTGTPPLEYLESAGVTPNAEAFTLTRWFSVQGDFTFTAVEFTITPTHPLPGAPKTYGSVESSVQRSFVAGGVADDPGTPDRVVMVLEPDVDTVVVPTVEISTLGHSYGDDGFGGIFVSDGVTFPCGSGIGACSGPRFAAALEAGDPIQIRFAAPPNQVFHVTRHPSLAYQVFSVNAYWHTGVSDATSTSVPGPSCSRASPARRR